MILGYCLWAQIGFPRNIPTSTALGWSFYMWIAFPVIWLQQTYLQYRLSAEFSHIPTGMRPRFLLRFSPRSRSNLGLSTMSAIILQSGFGHYFVGVGGSEDPQRSVALHMNALNISPTCVIQTGTLLLSCILWRTPILRRYQSLKEWVSFPRWLE